MNKDEVETIIKGTKESPARTLAARIAPVLPIIEESLLSGLINQTELANLLGVARTTAYRAVEKAGKIRDAMIAKGFDPDNPLGDKKPAAKAEPQESRGGTILRNALDERMGKEETQDKKKSGLEQTAKNLFND